MLVRHIERAFFSAQAIVLFVSGNFAIAVSHVHDFIATVDNDAMYCYL